MLLCGGAAVPWLCWRGVFFVANGQPQIITCLANYSSASANFLGHVLQLLHNWQTESQDLTALITYRLRPCLIWLKSVNVSHF